MPIQSDLMENSVPSTGSPFPDQPETAGGGSDEPGSTLPWLQDVSRAAQHLTRLSLETAAQAALILQRSSLWAYAGELPQPAAEELAQVLNMVWEKGDGGDLARFVRLDSTGDEYMLYATCLDKGMVLGLVFNVETPFSKIRSQAGRLARALASPPDAETALHTPSPTLTLDAWIPESEQEKPIQHSPARPLFENVPPPSVSASPASLPPRPEIESNPKPFTANTASAVDAMSDSENEVDEMEDQENESPQVRHEFQPVSPAVYNLNYACLLIPRLPQHILAGDLAAKLSEWLLQLCTAFGWRLVHVAIRPDYLQWIVDIPPTTSPSQMLLTFRQYTSRYIFEEFPRLARENPSRDFWAPGYLIMGTSQPLPVLVLKDYIKRTRARQGA